jgi:hypothetical protein
VPRTIVDGKEPATLNRDKHNQSMGHTILLVRYQAKETTPVVGRELHDLGLLVPACIGSRTVELLGVVMTGLPLARRVLADTFDCLAKILTSASELLAESA